jgi:seryl-tRNA synthetase
MININLIRSEPDKVKDGIAKKNYQPEIVDQVLDADKLRLELLQKVEELRQERNEISKNHSPENITRGKEIKEELQKFEPQLGEIEEKINYLMSGIPNIPSEDVPVGKSEDDNVEREIVGEIPKFDFEVKDHVDLGKILDIIDFETGAKVTGSGFYYLKNEGAMLEIAVINYAMQFLHSRGFTPIITPDIAREKYYLGTGYLPKGEEAQTYKIEDTDLGLIATAEVTLAGYHADQILEDRDMPKKYGGYSHCFRREDGAYGKYSKGLYRVHQFSKVEMFAFTKAEDSDLMHQELLKIEKEFWQSLGVPFRVLEMCTADLGSQAVKKYDLEAWMPGRGDWGEITSTSNTTDYQSRNLNIRYKTDKGTEYAHTLNGTLIATSRGVLSLIELGQQADGSIKIPDVLIPYTGFSEISSKK